MSADSNSTGTAKPASSPSAVPPQSKTPLVVGFLTGAFFWAIPMVMEKFRAGYAIILPMVFACFVLPVAATIVAIIRRTRRFGLGLLLACGLGWLVLGAICGGLID